MTIAFIELLPAADERAIFSARRPSRLGNPPSVSAARRLQIAPPSKAFVARQLPRRVLLRAAARSQLRRRTFRQTEESRRIEYLDAPPPRNYNVSMKARIIQIGNSRGIRLPKALLEEAHLTEEVQIEAEANQIVIRSFHVPREGWEAAFQLMAKRGHDALDDEAAMLTSFDEAEWKW